MTLLALAAATTMMVGTNSVEVRSATNCPSTEEVGARLHPMLPSGWLLGPAGDMASVEVVESRADGVMELRLRLRRPDGSMGGDRRLVLQGGCEEMADAVATVIAAWETDFLPDSLPSPAVATPAAPAAPASPPSPVAVAPAQPVLNPQRSGPKPARLGISLGVSVGAAVTGGVAATGGIEAMGGRTDSRWQLRLAAATQTERRQKLDVGEVSWKHTTIAAGPVLRTLGPNWRFSGDAGPVLGWATLAGHGYSENRTQSLFAYGLGAGLRVERGLGRLHVWLEWRTNLWAESQQAELTGSAAREKLPRLDLTANLGASVRILR